MTDDTDETTDAQPTDEVDNSEHPDLGDDLGPGYFAEDREDSGTLVVIADTGKTASQHIVAAAGETVAELNPNYPEDDPVLFCAYRNALDSHFGEAWRDFSPEYLAFEVGDHGVPVYSFPESRLVPKEAEFEDGEEYPETGGDEEADDE